MQLYIEPDRLRDADAEPTEEKQYNLNLKVTRQLLSRIGKPHIVADSYLSNYSADETVIRADVVLLNESLIPCKSEHYVREIPQETEAPIVE